MTESLEKQVAEHTGQIGTISAEVHALGARMGGVEDTLAEFGRETREAFQQLQKSVSTARIQAATPMWPLLLIFVSVTIAMSGIGVAHMLSPGHAGVPRNSSDIIKLEARIGREVDKLDVVLQREIQLEVARSNDRIEGLDVSLQRELGLEITRLDERVLSLNDRMTLHGGYWKEQWQRR